MNTWDRLVSWFSPTAGLKRLQARAAAEVLGQRNYKAATTGHRTSGWSRIRSDVNALTQMAGAELRMHTRALIRDNGWAGRGQQVISNNVVGWGTVPKAVGPDAKSNTRAMELWNAWADSTDCESEGRSTFYALQAQVMDLVPCDGEVLVRRRWRKASDVGSSGEKLALPFQLQLLEADQLDSAKTEDTSSAGGKIVQGVEYDLLGRRAAYWIFPEHPGAQSTTGSVSRRVPASEILHIFKPLRPGQARGLSWFAAAILTLKDFDEWEDAELMRQKIAACFAAFVSDTTGEGAAIGEEDEDDETVDTIEPGMIHQLNDGETVTFGSPPSVTSEGFATRQLRRVAAAIGVTYEDLTGDYSQVNFSSARMGRLAHQANVKRWQYHMLIPQLCAGVWRWAMEAALVMGEVQTAPRAEWSVDPMPMIEPDKEGLALSRLVRNGAMTFSDMVRQVGGDPEAHWAEYAADKKRLDELGIMLDSDPEKTSQAGLTQARAGVDAGGAPPAEDPPAEDDAPEEKPKAKRDEVEVINVLSITLTEITRQMRGAK